MTRNSHPFSFLHLFALAFAVLLGGGGLSNAMAKVDHVFIISFDQGSPDGIARAKMPVLQHLVAEGAHTWEAYTIVPSLTLPSHVSMLTGVGIQKHQILWNDFIPEKGALKVPTIFSLAKKEGLVTALVAAKTKFKTLDLPGSLDAFILPEDTSAQSIANAFATMVAKLKPNLCFIHFADPDLAGHNYGVYSPEKMQALADCDAALQIILDAIATAGLTDSSVLILTADHGGHDVHFPKKEAEKRIAKGEPTKHGTHGSAETSDVVIPWIAWGSTVKKGFTITTPVITYDTAATALWLLGLPVPTDFWGHPVTSAFETQTP